MVKKLLGVLLALLSVLVGGITQADAAAPITLADIYNPAKVLRIDLALTPESVLSLNTDATLETYVPGVVTFSMDKKTSGPLDIKVRLKGSTSLMRLDAKPSFKFKFKKDAAGLGYLGLNKMTLNGMIQDTSKLHEYAAYALFNSSGVQASKTGWAQVFVNGTNKGIYINVETPDETFMTRRFRDITQHIYEGAGSDFYMGSDTGDNKSGAFLVDYGWKATPNKYDLNNLIATTYEIDKASWYKSLNNVLDRNQMIKFFAIENFIGHWDGYSGPDKNNYFIRSNTKGRFTFIPWGTDQTFGENLATWDVLGDSFDEPMLSDYSNHPWATDQYRGRLYVQCINYAPCKKAYLLALKSVSDKATSMKLSAKLTAAAKVIEPVLFSKLSANLDTLKHLDAIHVEQNRTINYIPYRQQQVKTLLQANGIY